MEDLYIKWDTGYMNIHMNFFFPCSQEHFKKLLKIIALDWRHEAELKEKLKSHFQNRIVFLTKQWEENGRKYYENKQKAADTTILIKEQSHPNGLPVSKDELKRAKADLKVYKAAYKKALSGAKANKRSKEQFEKYLKLL